MTDRLTDEQARALMDFHHGAFQRALMSYFPAVSGRDKPMTLDEAAREERAERLATGRSVPK